MKEKRLSIYKDFTRRKADEKWNNAFNIWKHYVVRGVYMIIKYYADIDAAAIQNNLKNYQSDL